MGNLLARVKRAVFGSREYSTQSLLESQIVKSSKPSTIQSVIPPFRGKVELKEQLPYLFNSSMNSVLYFLRELSGKQDPTPSRSINGPSSYWMIPYKQFEGFLYYDDETMIGLDFIDNHSGKIMTHEEINEFMVGLGFAPIQVRKIPKNERELSDSWNCKDYTSSLEGIPVNVKTACDEDEGKIHIFIRRSITEQ